MGLTSNFTNNFKALFKSQGWSQYSLGKAAGLSQSLIGSYLEGKRPTLDNLEKLSKPMGLGPLDLLGKDMPTGHTIDDCLAAVNARIKGETSVASTASLMLPRIPRPISELFDGLDESQANRVVNAILPTLQGAVASVKQSDVVSKKDRKTAK